MIPGVRTAKPFPLAAEELNPDNKNTRDQLAAAGMLITAEDAVQLQGARARCDGCGVLFFFSDNFAHACFVHPGVINLDGYYTCCGYSRTGSVVLHPDLPLTRRLNGAEEVDHELFSGPRPREGGCTPCRHWLATDRPVPTQIFFIEDKARSFLRHPPRLVHWAPTAQEQSCQTMYSCRVSTPADGPSDWKSWPGRAVARNGEAAAAFLVLRVAKTTTRDDFWQAIQMFCKDYYKDSLVSVAEPVVPPVLLATRVGSLLREAAATGTPDFRTKVLLAGAGAGPVNAALLVRTIIRRVQKALQYPGFYSLGTS